MTLEESQARDQPQAKNPDRYDRMVKFFSNAETKEDLQQAALLYVMDMKYDRGDIALALHTVEIFRGWHH